jgi:hypothetical protein
MNFADVKGQNSLPSLSDATKNQQKQFQNALKVALSKLKKGQCAKDFGAGAGSTLVGATYVLGVPMAYDTNGNPTAPSNPMTYATTNPATQTVTINLGGFFLMCSRQGQPPTRSSLTTWALG